MTCFLFHDWGRWSKPAPHESAWSGVSLRQIRECGRCGKAKSREVAWLDCDDPNDSDEIGQ